MGCKHVFIHMHASLWALEAGWEQVLAQCAGTSKRTVIQTWPGCGMMETSRARADVASMRRPAPLRPCELTPPPGYCCRPGRCTLTASCCGPARARSYHSASVKLLFLSTLRV